MHIGFVTASDLSRYFPSPTDPLLTHDDAVMKRVLVAAGHSVVPVVWGTDPRLLVAFDVLIVRSPWDYMDSDENRRGLFEWLRAVAGLGIRLENDLRWLLWNSDKIYLSELADLGVPVVPTRFLGVTDAADTAWLGSYFKANGPFVLKPSVSAAARDTFLIEGPDAAQYLSSANGKVEGDFSDWRGSRTFMLQPFLPEIKTRGEWSLVYFDGLFSHAVHKRPADGAWLVQDELGGSVLSAEPPAAVFTVAEQGVRALAKVGERLGIGLPLYLRIDVIEAESSTRGPLIGELEMIEPELFFLTRYANSEASENTEATYSFALSLARRSLPTP